MPMLVLSLFIHSNVSSKGHCVFKPSQLRRCWCSSPTSLEDRIKKRLYPVSFIAMSPLWDIAYSNHHNYADVGVLHQYHWKTVLRKDCILFITRFATASLTGRLAYGIPDKHSHRFRGVTAGSILCSCLYLFGKLRQIPKQLRSKCEAGPTLVRSRP